MPGAMQGRGGGRSVRAGSARRGEGGREGEAQDGRVGRGDQEPAAPCVPGREYKREGRALLSVLGVPEAAGRAEGREGKGREGGRSRRDELGEEMMSPLPPADSREEK